MRKALPAKKKGKTKGQAKKTAPPSKRPIYSDEDRPIDPYCKKRIGCWCEWCSVWGYGE